MFIYIKYCFLIILQLQKGGKIHICQHIIKTKKSGLFNRFEKGKTRIFNVSCYAGLLDIMSCLFMDWPLVKV